MAHPQAVLVPDLRVTPRALSGRVRRLHHKGRQPLFLPPWVMGCLSGPAIAQAVAGFFFTASCKNYIKRLLLPIGSRPIFESGGRLRHLLPRAP